MLLYVTVVIQVNIPDGVTSHHQANEHHQLLLVTAVTEPAASNAAVSF
jgi:hypothetical protein